MKIFIDGGARNSVKRMFGIWKKMGHTVTKKSNDADVQLSSIKIKKRSGLPIVLRLDGIYYDKSTGFNKRNKLISISHRDADAVIYQSYFSKTMCERYLLKRKSNVFEIIHNGINTSDWISFNKHDGINIVSCSKWRRHKRLQETVKLFCEYLHYFPNAKLHIIGPMMRGSRIIKHKNIIYYGKIKYDRMRKIYSKMDMFIHLSKKDSCPNSVVESIGAGIPVITTNACGGSTEMCQLTKDCIICNGDSNSTKPCFPYRDKYNVLPIVLKKNLIKAMCDISNDHRRVKLPDELNIKTTAERYINIMEKAIHRKINDRKR